MERGPRGGRGRGGCPPGLRGRDIGLYYRNLGLKRKQERGYKEEPQIRLDASVAVPPGVLQEVQTLIDCFDSSNNGNINSIEPEFEAQFHDLLNTTFEEFIAAAKAEHIESTEAAARRNTELNDTLKAELEAQMASVEFQQRAGQRQNLPTLKEAHRILAAVREKQVLLIVGSTGCGKTTQVPQLLLEEAIRGGMGATCRIVCTQPRRISAISVAQRVAYERFEKLGGSNSTVGYQIRLDSKLPREHGSMLYCTTGILLQKMQTDPLLSALSCVILDEIHERSCETDLLMALLKQILPQRPTLKVILMSATVCEQDFYDYFRPCMTLRIEGTLYPVAMHYLADILAETGYTSFQQKKSTRHGRPWQEHAGGGTAAGYEHMMEPYLREIRKQYTPAVLQALRCPDSEGCNNLEFVAYLIYHIVVNKPPGAILVFLPGRDKIAKLNDLLNRPSSHAFAQGREHELQVYPLHSMMPTIYQQSIFETPPPNVRKVILSTIIAETSVTIEDVVYVINCGRTKLTSYDAATNLQSLVETWVTHANTQQRRGRAGRVQPGVCYNLFSVARERTMDDKPTPEIVRCRLESIILNLKLLHISDAHAFLQTLISAPELAVIENGIELLKRIDVLDAAGALTPLGMHVARLPIEPQMAKMLLMSALFRCVDPITSVAAALSYKSPFYTPLGQERKVDAVKRDLASDTHSDHLLVDNIILNYRDVSESNDPGQFCYRNFLNLATLKQLECMKQQFAQQLKSARFLDEGDCSAKTSNVNADNVPLLRAIIAAGLYPNVAHLRRVRQIRNRTHAVHTMNTPEDRRVNFHPSSVNSGAPSFESGYFVYFQKQMSTALYLLDSTMVYPMALIIFADTIETGELKQQFYLSVGNDFYFKCDVDTAIVIKMLRLRFKLLLQKKALQPAPITLESSDAHLIRAIQILLSLDEMSPYEDQYASSGNEEER